MRRHLLCFSRCELEEASVRRQEAGGRRQEEEAGGRRQEAGGRITQHWVLPTSSRRQKKKKGVWEQEKKMDMLLTENHPLQPGPSGASVGPERIRETHISISLHLHLNTSETPKLLLLWTDTTERERLSGGEDPSEKQPQTKARGNRWCRVPLQNPDPGPTGCHLPASRGEVRERSRLIRDLRGLSSQPGAPGGSSQADGSSVCLKEMESHLQKHKCAQVKQQQHDNLFTSVRQDGKQVRVSPVTSSCKPAAAC
ncbi:unnamed protein product, partial [Pleuronectes platessa]